MVIGQNPEGRDKARIGAGQICSHQEKRKSKKGCASAHSILVSSNNLTHFTKASFAFEAVPSL